MEKRAGKALAFDVRPVLEALVHLVVLNDRGGLLRFHLAFQMSKSNLLPDLH